MISELLSAYGRKGARVSHVMMEASARNCCVATALLVSLRHLMATMFPLYLPCHISGGFMFIHTHQNSVSPHLEILPLQFVPQFQVLLLEWPNPLEVKGQDPT